jgi:hypothetical protein
LLSPDGRLCAAWELYHGKVPNVIRLYELNTGREFGSIPTMTSGGGVEFSADGTRLITELDYIWDITVSPPCRLGGEQGQRLQFSPDGKWLRAYSCLTGPIDTMAFFDAATFTKQPMPSEISALTIGPDTQSIAGKAQVTASAFQQWLARWLPGPARPPSYEALRVWTFPGWQEIATFPDAEAFAYLPDGRSIAVGRKEGSIEIWDIPPRRPWYIDYGLPVLFALLVLLGVRMVWRAVRRPVARLVASPA